MFSSVSLGSNLAAAFVAAITRIFTESFECRTHKDSKAKAAELTLVPCPVKTNAPY